MLGSQSHIGCQEILFGHHRCCAKIPPGKQDPGAWAGSVVHGLKTLAVCCLTSEEKWDKIKRILKDWYTILMAGDTELLHSKIASDRGFMVYVTRTYPPMIPYLKDFHLSLEIWRGGRDAEGWKLKPSKQEETREEDDELTEVEGSLGSLDASRALAHGVDHERASTLDHINPGTDEGVALSHKLRKKSVTGRLHGPASVLTSSVPRLIEDGQSQLRRRSVEPPSHFLLSQFVTQRDFLIRSRVHVIQS